MTISTQDFADIIDDEVEEFLDFLDTEDISGTNYESFEKAYNDYENKYTELRYGGRYVDYLRTQ